ncbi:MAG: CxxC-x17-CxxC domain-containing protein [Patescibacteria group bacterium]|jgi:CxxC-x17-CxxC domain-containing protein
MGKFNRDDRGGFGGKFGGRERSFDRGDRPEMHKATCAECGSSCEVPFRPSGDRPVLCSNCFKSSGRDNSSRRDDFRRDDRRSFDRPRFEEKKMFDATCSQCGNHCQVPFRPTQGKDVFCDACFGKEKGDMNISVSSSPAPKSAGYDKQFEALNVKLNKILELLGQKPEVAKKAEPVEMSIEAEADEEIAKAEVKKINKKSSSAKVSTSVKATADKAKKKVSKKK